MPEENSSPRQDPGPSAKAKLLPPKKKLHPWEVETAIPEPGKENQELPKILRPAWRLYAYTISTEKRRKFYVQLTRTVLVVGMCLIVTAIIYPELTNAGDPTLAQDPLTQSGMVAIPAHNCTVFASGQVDGGDEVEGNFSVASPTWAQVVFDVIENGTGTWCQRAITQHVASLPGPTSQGMIDLPANYTDWYFFVFTNPNPFPISVYDLTDYYSSLPPV